jgi:hypothetical protein
MRAISTVVPGRGWDTGSSLAACQLEGVQVVFVQNKESARC